MRSNTVHHLRTTCRCCDSTRLSRFLSLGSTPLANSFLSGPEQFQDEATYPLDVFFCEDCTLVQLLDVIDPVVLFRDYIYVTGISTTIAEHYVEYARTAMEVCEAGPDDLVVEIASNDGSLLRHFQGHGVKTLGIEPAANIADIARSSGVPTIDRFFNLETARDVRREHGPATVITANNVLAHVDEPKEFLEGCRALATDDGLIVIEVPYLAELLERIEYDTIYHEHLCYFSVTAMARLCEAAGLAIVRIDRVPVHGGSLRVYARPADRFGHHQPDIERTLDQERRDGLSDLGRYARFADAVSSNKQSLLDLLRHLSDKGQTLGAYGAPAKGNTLLNYCRIDPGLVAFTVDRNPNKIGRYTPGMHLPVLHASELEKRQPDFTLLLAWNFADEIMEQQQTYRSRGGRFVIPIPQPRIV